MGVGRPRSRPSDGAVASPEKQILDAAAALFSTRGYAGTSTRAIAEAAGLRQPSLYYHFASKEEIFARLVGHLWRPALSYGERLTSVDAPPDALLYALLSYDVEALRSLPWRIGTLYFAPELRAPEFAAVAEERVRLRSIYREFTGAGVAAGAFLIDDPGFASNLLFGLTEGIVHMSDIDDGRSPTEWGVEVADYGMRLLAAADPAAARSAGSALREVQRSSR
jgi:AcrR family transcriptional regulator